MKEITPEQIKAYLAARVVGEHGDNMPGIFEVALADALRDTTAAMMQSEFEREHDTDYHSCWDMAREQSRECDPRHAWTPEQWQQAADKYCRGEG